MIRSEIPSNLPRLDDDEDEPKKKKDDAKEEKPSSAIEERLFKSRSVFIFGEINMKVARAVTAQLVALAADSEEPINVFVNSPGGHVESGDTIHDMIRFVKPRVRVIGTGWVASAGAHIFLGAKRENRYSLPNTRFLLHQPSGGAGGQASDIAIQAKEIIKMRERLNRIIAAETGQPLERVAKDTDRDYWMSAEEAKTYGVVNKIINNVTELD